MDYYPKSIKYVTTSYKGNQQNVYNVFHKIQENASLTKGILVNF